MQILGAARHQAMEEEMNMIRTATVRTLLEGTCAAALDQSVFLLVNSQASLLEEEMETGCKNNMVVTLPLLIRVIVSG